MISETSSTHQAAPPVHTGGVDPRVRRVLALMEENYHRELSLDVLARAVSLSTWHLGHLFKNEVGASPFQHLRSLRMRRAGVLLATTFLSVKEIMYKVGVHDQSHFAKDFKRFYGTTPTRYRDAHAEMHRDEPSQQDAPKSSKTRPPSPIEAATE
jgi:transcriptional regulator GlxA family with amidase domain